MERYLAEENRAPLYHATGPHALVEILRVGEIRARGPFISTSRDKAFRYYHVDGAYGTAGLAPFQIVLDADTVRQRFAVRPIDYAFDPQDGYAEDMPPRAEMEERIYTQRIPFTSRFVKSLIFEPVTRGFIDNVSVDDEDFLVQHNGTLTIDPALYDRLVARAKNFGVSVIDRR